MQYEFTDLALVVVADAALELVHGDELTDVLDDELTLLHRLLDEQAPPAPVRHGNLEYLIIINSYNSINYSNHI